MGDSLSTPGEGGENLPARSEYDPTAPNLDMTRRGDRNMFARAIERGWSVSPARKAAYFAALDNVVREAAGMAESPVTLEARGKIIVSAARVLVAEQGQALKDLQKVDEYERIDAGKATALAEHNHTHRHTIDYDALQKRLVASTTIASRALPAEERVNS
jgi:hypothetical protein